jgi:hypothetical protein
VAEVYQWQGTNPRLWQTAQGAIGGQTMAASKFLSEDVKLWAREWGARLVGIASADRFEGAPEGYHPRDILPGTTSPVSRSARSGRRCQGPLDHDADIKQAFLFSLGKE